MNESNRVSLWYINRKGVWCLFYNYGFNFAGAMKDARGTLGIDLWAILRGGRVVAMHRDASLHGFYGAVLREQYGMKFENLIQSI